MSAIKPVQMIYIPNLKFKTTYCHHYLNSKKQFYQKLFVKKEKIASSPTVNNSYVTSNMQCIFDILFFQFNFNYFQNQFAISMQNQAFPLKEVIENYKTIYCKFYAKGECKFGEACTFIHQKKEKRSKKNHENQQQIPYQLEANYFANQMQWPIYQMYQYTDGSSYYECKKSDEVPIIQNFTTLTQPILLSKESHTSSNGNLRFAQIKYQTKQILFSPQLINKKEGSDKKKFE